MGPLLCDIARSLYDTLESLPPSRTADAQKAVHHVTLEIGRLLEDIARNIALHPCECEHEDLLLGMLGCVTSIFISEGYFKTYDAERAAKLCEDLARKGSSFSMSELEGKLSNIASYAKELRVAFDVRSQ